MKKSQEKHSVKATIQILDLSKAGTSLELEVFAKEPRHERRKIGTVIIGRGSLTWKKDYGKKGRRISWSRFAEMME
ncbi:MAG: hypothetical protein ABSF62_04325 [Bryobacteraceae bacterium]|jgi:hypothetical protein